MYPFLRMVKETWANRNAPPLGLTGTHVSHHICWPWDLDIWMELNNGRTLTLYDLDHDLGARQRWWQAVTVIAELDALTTPKGTDR